MRTYAPKHVAGATAIRNRRLVQRTLVVATATSALAGILIGSASADDSNGSTTANVGVEAGITLTGLTPSFTISGAPGATVVGTDAVSLNVETNNVAGYTVTVQATSSTMTPDDGANLDVIPIADLTVREGNSGAFTPLSATVPVTVHTQSGRSANGGDSLTNDYQIRIPVVNVDNYSATLDYVATTL